MPIQHLPSFWHLTQQKAASQGTPRAGTYLTSCSLGRLSAAKALGRLACALAGPFRARAVAFPFADSPGSVSELQLKVDFDSYSSDFSTLGAVLPLHFLRPATGSSFEGKPLVEGGVGLPCNPILGTQLLWPF
jgi:hypothetical protein